MRPVSPEDVVKRGWPVLASIGVNGALVALLLSLPQKAPGPDNDPRAIIPVTLVDLPPRPEPEPEEEEQAPEEDPPPQAERERAPTPPAPSGNPSPNDTAAIQSPIIARPDEAVDADQMAGSGPGVPELDLPVFADREERAAGALRTFRCGRLGRDRPAWCDDTPDAIPAPARAGFADTPDMAAKAFADFQIEAMDPKVKEILAEGCGPSRGVIRDAVSEDTSYQRQGAHAAVGMLSEASRKAECN